MTEGPHGIGFPRRRLLHRAARALAVLGLKQALRLAGKAVARVLAGLLA